jgi:DNA-binding transcriptional ArsR family regulator
MSHRTLTSEREIAAFVHRARMDILAALRDGPSTGSQIGERLGVHPANLTRHLRTLVDAGLVELAETRDTGRNLEKYYRATADSFDVAPEAHALRAPQMIALAMARSDLSAALARLSEDDVRPVAALVVGARIAPGDVTDFADELRRLVARFSAADRVDGAGYHLNLALYPGEVDTGLSGAVVLERLPQAAAPDGRVD